jgi:hypothetical protein
MGFNLFGYLVKGPFPALPALEAAFGRTIKGETKVSFETATLRKDDFHHLDVVRTETGFLILCDAKAVKGERAARLSAGTESLTFLMSETSMTFMFEKYEDGKKLWEDGALFEGKLTRMGSELPLDEKTDVVFHTFPALTREFAGVDFHGIDLSEPVTRYRLGPALAQPLAQSQPAEKPAEPATPQGDFRQEAAALFFSFWDEVILNKKKGPDPLRKEGGRTVYSFESYLREKGVGQEQIRRYGEYVSSKEFSEVMKQRQRGNLRKGIKAAAIAFGAYTLVLMVVYFILGLVVSVFTGTSVWSLAFWGWVTAAAVLTCAFTLLRAIFPRAKNVNVFQVFDGR